jgi:hypothetical protein
MLKSNSCTGHVDGTASQDREATVARLDRLRSGTLWVIVESLRPRAVLDSYSQCD